MREGSAPSFSRKAIRILHFTNWFGWNDTGTLGLGDTIRRSSPVQIGNLSSWIKISAFGWEQFAALRNDGTIWVSGHNGDGQLGLGDTQNRSSPVQVGNGSQWIDISIGVWNSFFLRDINGV